MPLALRQIQIIRDDEGPVTQPNHCVNTSPVRYGWPKKMTMHVALEKVPDEANTDGQFVK